MSELADLAVYLAQAGHGKVAGLEKTIFANFMPAAARKGVLVRQDYLGIQYVPELPGYFKTSFQIIVRNPDYVEGETLAKNVSVTLNQERVVIGSMQMLYIRPRHKPIVYPASQGDLLEFSVSFDACYLIAS